METITSYFSEIPSAHRSLILIGGLTIFFIIENSLPLFRFRHNKWKHTGVNIFFTITTILVNFSMAALLVGASYYVTKNEVGLLQWVSLGLLGELIVGLLVLDLVGAWMAHWTEHKVKFLWQFHVIHHTDQHVDTTTANRHHPGESVVRFIFTVMAVLIVGAPIWLVFLYQSMSAFLSQFNHSNVKMPSWLDSTLNLVICTPNMHRVHHHFRQPYSDTNYGNLFSFWDRIFGTYVKVDNEKLVYGVDTYMNTEQVGNIWDLLKIPFQGYKKPIQYDKEEVL